MSVRGASISLACSLVLLAGCSAAPQSSRATRPAPASPGPRVGPRVGAPVRLAARAPGPLRRSEIDALLGAGLGPLLARVRVTPVFSHARFVGFRLDAADDLDAWHAAGADLRVGDVILRVNGVRIERPEQAVWAFERLRIAPEISVEILRAGASMTVLSPIL